MIKNDGGLILRVEAREASSGISPDRNQLNFYGFSVLSRKPEAVTFVTLQTTRPTPARAGKRAARGSRASRLVRSWLSSTPFTPQQKTVVKCATRPPLWTPTRRVPLFFCTALSAPTGLPYAKRRYIARPRMCARSQRRGDFSDKRQGL